MGRARARRAAGILVWASLAIVPVASATTPEGYRVAFVTSTTGYGKLGDSVDASHWVETSGTGLSGLAAGDHICQVRAEAAGLASSDTHLPIFRAWLSDSLDDAYCHVQGLTGKRFDALPCDNGTEIGGGPWVLVDGYPFSGNLASLVAPLPGGPIRPPVLDENGAFRIAQNFYTGTDQDGTRNDFNNNCNSWTDGTNVFFGPGGHTSVLNSWSGGSSTSCNTKWRLLCFEQGTGTTPTLPREPGAFAFVSSEAGSAAFTDWTSSGGTGGMAGADLACQTLAGQAGLPSPESFVAFLSDGSVNAIDRLTIDGPWKRVDGFLIAATKAAVTGSNTRRTPIWLDEQGHAALDHVWTGSTTAGTNSSTNCGDWTIGTIDSKATRGQRYRSDIFWIAANSEFCDTSQHVYCFSNVVSIFWDGFESNGTDRWSAATP